MLSSCSPEPEPVPGTVFTPLTLRACLEPTEGPKKKNPAEAGLSVRSRADRMIGGSGHEIEILRDFAISDFGSVSVSTPLSNSAFSFSWSMPCGTVKERVKRP